MIGELINTSSVLFKSLIAHKYKSGSDKFFLVGKCIVENISFRLPNSSESDLIVGVRVLIRTIKKVLYGRNPVQEFEGEKILLFDSTSKFVNIEKEYVAKQSGHKIGFFVAKSDLPYLSGILEKLLLVILICMFSIPLVIASLFSNKYRSNYALMITEIVECASLISIVKNKEIELVYDFAPFEKDSNLLFILLEKLDVRVTKMPSAGPLVTHNHTILTSTLVLSSQYQFDELEQFADTIIADKIEKWVPEAAFGFIDKYAFKEKILNRELNTVGFYSHGSWIRTEQDHADDGLGILHAEEKLLNDLNLLLANNNKIKLIIFPHPKEKKMGRKMVNHYNCLLADVKFEIANLNNPTVQNFEKVDIAMGCFSTILYERLFCNFKTLFGAYGIKDFPVENSALENISFDSFESLRNKLFSSLIVNTDQFFIKNELKGYRYFEYNYFTNTSQA